MKRHDDARCPLCRSDRIEPIARFHRRVFTKSGFRAVDIPVSACRICGFAFQDPMPSESDAVETHRNVFYPTWESRDPAAAAEERLAWFDRTLPLPPAGTALDVGCGTPHLLRLLSRRGWEGVGIDVGEEVPYDEGGTDGVRVIRTPFASAPFADGSFDLIHMDNVLEHLPEARSALSRVAGLLKPDGVAVVIVPTIDAQRDHWEGIFMHEHVNFFNDRTLGHMARAAGLSARIAGEYRPGEAVVAVCSRRGDGRWTPAPGDYDRTRQRILAYAEIQKGWTRRVQEEIQPCLDRAAERRERVVIYGAGSFTLTLLEALNVDHLDLLGFMDSNERKRGLKIGRHPIHHPDDLPALKPSLVFISVNQESFEREIRLTLAARGGKNPPRVESVLSLLQDRRR